MRFELTLAFLVAVAQADEASCAALAKTVNETLVCRTDSSPDFQVCCADRLCTENESKKDDFLAECGTIDAATAEMAKQKKSTSKQCKILLDEINAEGNTCNADFTVCTGKDEPDKEIDASVNIKEDCGTDGYNAAVTAKAEKDSAATVTAGAAVLAAIAALAF